MGSMTKPAYAEIATAIEEFAVSAPTRAAVERFAAKTISARLEHYNWTGFYWVDPKEPEMLELGEFVGAPTEHVRIPVSRGICGAAVAQAQTIVVDDVHSDPRYLACSIETKSEIVVPIEVNGKIVGEIDIDSHIPAAFGAEDRAFLQRCSQVFARFF